MRWAAGCWNWRPGASPRRRAIAGSLVHPGAAGRRPDLPLHRTVRPAGVDPQAAKRLAKRLHDAGQRLGRHPDIGRPVSGDRRELVTVSPYVIVYRTVPGEVRILRVWHEAQLRD
jgi:toxin ParE1/3/4